MPSNKKKRQQKNQARLGSLGWPTVFLKEVLAWLRYLFLMRLSLLAAESLAQLLLQGINCIRVSMKSDDSLDVQMFRVASALESQSVPVGVLAQKVVHHLVPDRRDMHTRARHGKTKRPIKANESVRVDHFQLLRRRLPGTAPATLRRRGRCVRRRVFFNNNILKGNNFFLVNYMYGRPGTRVFNRPTASNNFT